MTTTKLVAGKKYDTSLLKFVEWNGSENMCAGYYVEYYFKNGVYLGPDEFGIEPLFEILDEKFLHNETRKL